MDASGNSNQSTGIQRMESQSREKIIRIMKF
jgi:hypothetical protein